MAKLLRTPEVKEVTVAKPVPTVIYEDGIINMPAEMITKDLFYKIWNGKLKGRSIDEAWEKAKKFKAKLK